MRFLVDENTGPIVSGWLRDQGHDVFCVFSDARGSDDDSILFKADQESRIVITADKDFGVMVFKEKKAHHGIILLRLKDESPANQISVLKRLFEQYPEKLSNHFTVVTERTIRNIPS